MASPAQSLKSAAFILDNTAVIAGSLSAFFGGTVRNVMLQTGAATGDVFQVAAALKLHTDFGVAILTSAGNPRDRGQWIYNYYVREWGISSARVVLQTAANAENVIASINSKKLLQSHGLTSGTVGWATNLLQQDLGSDNPDGSANAERIRKLIKGAHRSHGMSCEKLQAYCQTKKIPVGGNLVVLWSRRSGKSQGLHEDLDSSTTVMAQIAERLQETHAVILAGDLPRIKTTTHAGFSKAFFLGEFWKDLAFQYSERSAQILLFEFLRRNSASLVHVGMRSGALDSYAIAGHKVVYILDTASVANDNLRMGKLLHDKVHLDYGRVEVKKAPKVFGQLQRGSDPGIPDGFDLKAKLISFRKTAGKSLNTDPEVKGVFDLLQELLQKTPKAEQYRFFKRDVKPGMWPLIRKDTPNAPDPAAKSLMALCADLLDHVYEAVQRRRMLDEDDMKLIIDEINRTSS